MRVNKKLIAFIFVFTAIITTYFFIPNVDVLSISNRKNPKDKIYSINAHSLGFCISYTHSVNKGRVHDYYKVDPITGNLIMTETHFVSYGAGIPEPEETEGADFQVLDNGYLITNINRQVPKLVMAVGLIADHTLSICYSGGVGIGNPVGEIPFTDFFAPQTSLIIEHKKVCFADYLIHKFKDDYVLY